MRVRQHPLSGRISCAECGAKYNATCENKWIASKGRRLSYSYPLLIHPRPTICKSIAKRVPLDVLEEILEDEYEKVFVSKDTPKVASVELIKGSLEDQYEETFRSKSGAQHFPHSLTAPVGESMNQMDREGMLDQTAKVIASATQVFKDLSENMATLGNTIDDVYKLMLQWEFLMRVWKPMEEGVEVARETSELKAPILQSPEMGSGEYAYLEAIESATISGKFDVKSMDHRTPRVLHLKFRGKESVSIPLDEE